MSPATAIDQTLLFETFAKLCAQMNDKNTHVYQVVSTTYLRIFASS